MIFNMENDNRILLSQEGLAYEKPQFMELDASFVFGVNPESGGRDDGNPGTNPETGGPENEETYDDNY